MAYYQSRNIILGECKVFVGERNERKRQGRLRLRVARGRMRTDRGRLMTYKIAIEFTSTGSLRSPKKYVSRENNGAHGKLICSQRWITSYSSSAKKLDKIHTEYNIYNCCKIPIPNSLLESANNVNNDAHVYL